MHFYAGFLRGFCLETPSFMFKMHKSYIEICFLLAHVPKSVFGVLTSCMRRAIIAPYYFICNVRCNMAFIASTVSVAIICAILGLVLLVKGSDLNSAESCAMLCKATPIS